MTDRFLLTMLTAMFSIVLLISMWFFQHQEDFDTCNGNLVCEEE